MSSCIRIASKKQIVLVFLDPYGHVEVASFKGRVEDDLVASCIQSQPPAVFSYSLHCLLHSINRSTVA